MGRHAAVVTSTQEDRISPLSFFFEDGAIHIRKVPSRRAIGCCSNIPDLKKDILYNLKVGTHDATSPCD